MKKVYLYATIFFCSSTALFSQNNYNYDTLKRIVHNCIIQCEQHWNNNERSATPIYIENGHRYLYLLDAAGQYLSEKKGESLVKRDQYYPNRNEQNDSIFFIIPRVQNWTKSFKKLSETGVKVYTIEYNEVDSLLYMHVVLWNYRRFRFFKSPHIERKNPIFKKKIAMGAISWGNFTYHYSEEKECWVLTDIVYGGP